MSRWNESRLKRRYLVQYDAKDPEDCIAQLDEGWRKETLLYLWSLVRATGPSLVEGIQYKMLSFSDNNGTFCHLNAQKAYVSLYMGNTAKIDPGGSLLAGLDHGKGCIHFKKSTNLVTTRITTFLERAFELHDQGVDMGC